MVSLKKEEKMSRTEITELTVLCLIHDEERYLLQDVHKR